MHRSKEVLEQKREFEEEEKKPISNWNPWMGGFYIVGLLVFLFCFYERELYIVNAEKEQGQFL